MLLIVDLLTIIGAICCRIAMLLFCLLVFAILAIYICMNMCLPMYFMRHDGVLGVLVLYWSLQCITWSWNAKCGW